MGNREIRALYDLHYLFSLLIHCKIQGGNNIHEVLCLLNHYPDNKLINNINLLSG